MPLGAAFKVRLAAQFTDQRAVGDALLGRTIDGEHWATQHGAGRAQLVIGDLTLKHRPITHQHPLPHDTFDAMAIMERHGAECSATISASEADFERYASHHRHSTLVWARQNPDHPETPEVLQKSRADWLHYQREIRPQMGWTIFVGRRA